MTQVEGFNGFSANTLAFLGGLAANNDRAWFAAHKGEYQELVQAPMWRLVNALAPAMLAIDPGFDLSPRGGAVSRIYRDTRFSRDKAPYRINQWIAFKRRSGEWQDRPCYFMEFGPDGYRYGMGFYSARPDTMRAIRRRIEVRPRDLTNAMDEATGAGFTLEGEAYKKPRLPAGQPPAIQEWYRLRNIYLARARPIDAVFASGALAEELRRAFAAAAPLYHFLADAIAIPA